ncbi:MAG: 2-oxo acid dehydrogenase subunit E2 [Anaerolineae bacterium]|nr:2-oxo acid dehydrogenase subunit E2 [Anaerolineae bacterium]
MAKDIIMPALGMAQETGILLEWLKAEGDEVAKGEPLMEIETDKATVEVEAPASGMLANVTAGPGDEIPVGHVIALILAPGETAPSPAQSGSAEGEAVAETVPPSPSPSPQDRAEVLASPLAARIAAEHNVDLTQVQASGSRVQKQDVLAYLESQSSDEGRVLASPKARRLAHEEGLLLADIQGSGPDGAVLAADVLQAATAAAAAVVEAPVVSPPPPVEPPVPVPPPLPVTEAETLPVSRMWRVMAQRLTESWTTIPHFYLTTEANATGLIAWREQVKQRVAEKVTFTDLLVKLVATALRRHPHVNARWVDGTIVTNADVNVGLAVAVDEGLLVPVIHRADSLGLGELAVRRKDLVTRAQAGKLTPDDMSSGTFTISNLGMFGIDAFNAIVNPPQAAILALGRIAERVVPVEGQPAVQPMMTMTLSSDHRVVDGARGAQFLQTLVGFIEDPMTVLD